MMLNGMIMPELKTAVKFTAPLAQNHAAGLQNPNHEPAGRRAHPRQIR